MSSSRSVLHIGVPLEALKQYVRWPLTPFTSPLTYTQSSTTAGVPSMASPASYVHLTSEIVAYPACTPL